MPAYFIYARKSTDDEDRQILSLESQLHELREFAAREDITIVEEFVEAKTAKEPGRPVFNLMMEQVETGKAEGLLAWHPDRLARNSVDGGRIIYLLDTGKLMGLRFPTYRLDNTAQGKFMLSIAFGQSKYYVDNLSDNVKRGLREKIRRGEWPAWAPVGYMSDYKNHTVVPHPEKAVLVKKLFELYATGDYSVTELYREALRWGFTGRTGKPIYKSGIWEILRNPFYYGMMLYKSELYEGSHPPLISKKLFDQVREVLTQQAKPVKHGVIKYRFIGLMRCGECGCMITAETQKGHVYYRCTKKKREIRCTQRFLREEALLAQLNEVVMKVAMKEETREKIIARWNSKLEEASNASTSQSRRIADEMKRCDQKMERLLDFYVEREIGPEEYRKKKAAILQRKQELKELLGEIERGGGIRLEPLKAVLTTCVEVGSVAGQENPAALKTFLRRVGSNFLLKDRTLAFSYTSPYDLVAKTDPNENWLPGQDSNLGHAD